MRAEEQIIAEMGKLAQLAYKKLGGHDGYNIGDIIPDFEDKEKTYKLNSKYRVIDYADNNDTDMQALLLERGETNDNGEFQGSGNYVLAFRGTKGKVDIASSICKDIFVKRTCKFKALSEII
nr:hypothetical protein [uncultured Campylobacter sp.]